MPKTVVITGAGRGIGLHLAQSYAARGDTVIAGVRSKTTQSEALAATRGVTVVALDVADQASVQAFASEMGDRPVDILINNAGVIGGDHQSLKDMDYDAWLDTFAVNTLGPFRVITALLPRMGQGAKVITLTSQMGSLALTGGGQHAYRSSKAAANKVMQVMAGELKDRGIIVCPMHPGWVRTDMGGPSASISVEESSDGIISVVDGLTLAESGRFWTWKGDEHPW